MFFYGAVSVLVGMLWILFGKEPYQTDSSQVTAETIPIRQTFLKLIRFKPLWFIGSAALLRVGSVMGVTGYLPLYLRGQGWELATADGTLSAFFAVSTICVIPLSLLSDKIGSRKAILFPALISFAVCFALLPFTQGGAIFALTLLAGISFDGFASLTVTTLLETKGLGSIHSGIALGALVTMSQMGNFIIPPLGNSLASINPGAPFLLWAAFSALALIPLAFIRETGWRNKSELY